MGFRLPARQLSLFSRPLVSFYRVWSIELSSHFAQVYVCLIFLSITVFKINVAAHYCWLNARRYGTDRLCDVTICVALSLCLLISSWYGEGQKCLLSFIARFLVLGGWNSQAES